jgi:hypothetical protein
MKERLTPHIAFNYELRCAAIEVRYVVIKLVLLPEFEPEEPSISK